jgi:release factor glutamine methyltransferase
LSNLALDVAPLSTIAELLRSGARALEGRSDSPRLDAELLLGFLLGLSRSALVAHDHDSVAADRVQDYAGLIDRRRNGSPIAYLTGIREFWSLELDVTPAVLVPRPETELIVELALELLPPRRVPEGAPYSVLDLGTGSGAIALALAAERPEWRLTGVDVSPPALAVAAGNSRKLGLSRIDWRPGSWFEPVAGSRFDLIVANPPYVAAGDPALEKLAAEPAIALAPGPTGLEALSAIVRGAAAHLLPDGWLVLEHGADQGPDVAQLLERHGFLKVRCYSDFSGKPRVTLGAVHSTHQEPL